MVKERSLLLAARGNASRMIAAINNNNVGDREDADRRAHAQRTAGAFFVQLQSVL